MGAPVVALTTPGTILLAVAALAALVYADRSDAMVGAAAAGLVFVQLEHVWSTQPRAVEAAAALAGLALLVASELRAWSRTLVEAPADAATIRAHAAAFVSRCAAIAAVVAAFVLLARGVFHPTLLAVAGSAAAIALFAALLRRVREVVHEAESPPVR